MHTTFVDRLPAPEKIKRALKIAEVLGNDMRRCDLFRHASAMAYVTLFSLVPSLAVTFGLISLFKPFLGQDSALLFQLKSFILQNLATGAGEQVIGQLDTFISNLDMTKIGLTGVAGLLFTLILLLRQIEEALNRIWLVVHPRGIVTRFVYFWTFLTLGTLVIGLTVGIVAGFDLQRLNPFNKDVVSQGHKILAVIAPFISVFVSFTFVYKVVPNTKVNIKDAMLGALPASIMFMIAGGAYRWFAPNFTSYRAIYGALAAVPLFLLWLYIMWVIILFGALLAWRFEQSFDIKDDMDQQSHYLTIQERIRNNQLQGIIPYLCAMVVHQIHEEGNGKGITGLDISQRLNIPSPWIAESMDFLTSIGVVISTNNSGDEATNLLTASYYPAHPAHSLTEQQLMERIFNGCEDWLKDWKHHWTPDLKPLLANVLKNIRSNETRTLDKIVLAKS